MWGAKGDRSSSRVRMSPLVQPFFWKSPTSVIMAAMAVLNFMASMSSATFLMHL